MRHIAESISIPLYGGEVRFFTSESRLRIDYEAMNGNDFKVGMSGCAIQFKPDDPVKERIWLVGVFDGTQRTLAHEMAHVALNICQNVGIDPQSSGGEPFCYLLDALVGAFEEKVARVAKKDSTKKAIRK